MPINRNDETPLFHLPGLSVRGHASPTRGAQETSVWQIALAPGAPGVPHAVTREEIFVATAGEAAVTMEGHTHRLAVGDVLIVPAGVEFALANPTDSVFEAFVVFPVGGQAITREGTFTPTWAA